MTPGPGRRKWFWYLRPGPGGMPLALRLSEGLGIARVAVMCFIPLARVTSKLYYPPLATGLAADCYAKEALSTVLHVDFWHVWVLPGEPSSQAVAVRLERKHLGHRETSAYLSWYEGAEVLSVITPGSCLCRQLERLAIVFASYSLDEPLCSLQLGSVPILHLRPGERSSCGRNESESHE
jgi:hypothetical protein